MTRNTSNIRWTLMSVRRIVVPGSPLDLISEITHLTTAAAAIV